MLKGQKVGDIHLCKIRGCTKKRHAKDLCPAHYYRQVKAGIKDSRKAYRLRRSRTIEGQFVALRNKAAHRGLSFTLSLEDYAALKAKPCYYCNNALHDPTKFGGLDRIDNSIGYELNNVLPSCRFCNVVRNEYLSVDEMKAVAQLLLTMRHDDTQNR